MNMFFKNETKGYWYLKSKPKLPEESEKTFMATSKVYKTQATADRNFISSHSYESAEDNILKKVHAYGIKVEKLQKQIGEVQSYFQSQLERDFNTLGIKCFQHNEQIIFYCTSDCQLVCSNCVYDGVPEQKKRMKERSAGSSKSPIKPISQSKISTKQKSLTNHKSHQLKQLCDAVHDVDHNIKQWTFEQKGNIHKVYDRSTKWKKVKQQFDSIKNQMKEEIQKLFELKRAELSQNYLKCKQELEDLSLPYQSSLTKIYQNLNNIATLAPAKRYPIPLMKHAWLQEFNKKIEQLPPDLDIANKVLETTIRSDLKKCLQSLTSNK